jgi:cytochrome P450
MIAVHRDEPEHMPLTDLVGQMILLFGASHETTAKAVMWTLFLVSQHPRVAAQAHDELVETCGDQPPTIADLERLPLLDAITKEAMRLLPPIPWISKRLGADSEMAGHPVFLRDIVFLDIYGSHRDPDVFSRPDQFRPDRWFGPEPEPFAYIPFSAGPRTCLAKSLGTTTINLLVAMILQRFRLTMVPGSRIDRKVYITLTSKRGLPMTILPQDRRFRAEPVQGDIHEMVDLTRGESAVSLAASHRRACSPPWSKAA